MKTNEIRMYLKGIIEELTETIGIYIFNDWTNNERLVTLIDGLKAYTNYIRPLAENEDPGDFATDAEWFTECKAHLTEYTGDLVAELTELDMIDKTPIENVIEILRGAIDQI